MKDIAEEKSQHKNAMESILLNMRMNDSGSSSSLDSKDSNKIGKVPSQIDPTEKRWFISSATCDLDKLKTLLEKNCELLNKKDYFTGFAAIHWAAKKGRCDVISWLAEHEADTNIRTNGGYTPLHIATMHSNESIIQKLIRSCNADINLRDYSGRKARHYASTDLSASVNRALQETPSVLEMIVDPQSQVVATSGFVAPTPLPIRRQASMRAPTYEKFSEESSFKKKKKGLSISTSFKMKKRTNVIRRESRGDLLSGADGLPQWQRSPSVPDIVFLANQADQTDYSKLCPSSPLVRRKASVSEMVVNGYAGFINDTKHRKQSMAAVENKEWGINTWI